MIDPADQQTQALPLDEQPAKKRRGRPATGKAMTPAEKQRAYRERLKSNVTDSMHKQVAEDLRAELAKALERIEELEAESKKRARTIVEQARMIQEADSVLIRRVEMAEAERDAMAKELDKAKVKATKAGPTKRRYVLQFRYEDANGMHWHDDKTGDYGSKKRAEDACKRMNEPGVSETEWRVRERQWV